MRIKCNPQKLLMELEYYVKYYGNDFRKNQGLEEIIKAIRMYSKHGKWLDLGGGSNSPFWRMFFPKLESIVCVDINQEAFLVSELIITVFFESPCYREVRQRFDVMDNGNSNIKIEYKKMDLLSEKIVFDCEFDNITQFGLLGLLKNEVEYINKTQEILKYLKTEGVYLGVNWIFSEKYKDKMGFSNEYICKKLLSDIESHSIKLCHYEEIKIQNDTNYDKCILFVVRKGNIV